MQTATKPPHWNDLDIPTLRHIASIVGTLIDPKVDIGRLAEEKYRLELAQARALEPVLISINSTIANKQREEDKKRGPV